MTPAAHRDQLIALLSEAAEIEHCLMCTYLYAAFSLKQSESEDLSPDELSAVRRWRGEIISIATDEMLHLALVNNLLIAVGTPPHYRRFNFPIGTGLFPADVAVALAPLEMATLDHFIYLERPSTVAEHDGATYEKAQYTRTGLPGRLMDANADYATVGELYQTILASFEKLCGELGEAGLLIGSTSAQLCDKDVHLPGLCLVSSLADARQAVELIIHQGEGSQASGEHAQSHYARFCAIRTEWQQLVSARADFVPYRPAAKNPVMRTPVVTQERIQIVNEPALSLLDVGNVSYVTMLRLLAIMSDTTKCGLSRAQVMRQTITLMHLIADIGSALTTLPANPLYPNVNAGLTFTVSRGDLSYQSSDSAACLLAERLSQIAQACLPLAPRLPSLTRYAAQLKRDADDWLSSRGKLHADGSLQRPVTVSAPQLQIVNQTVIDAQHPSSVVVNETAETEDFSVAYTDELVLHFDGKRCIHARHCVMGEPEVFLANTPGKWLFPEKATPERIAIVANNCPSGAITYERRDAQPGEATPKVNVLRVRENGPLAVQANITLEASDGGESKEFRMTLCRCGQSQNKPFCDGSHNAAAFTASGEPATRPSEPLAHRDGELRVSPLLNGPLEINGSLEICAGTGRTIDRVTSTRLCRCGQSKNKPFCDNTHAVVGFVADGV
jgi:CDGSH-type Zn-finger protein/uncharacterized Fe-S cluster protein YjdI